MSHPPPEPVGSLEAWPVDDPAAWDAFVESAAHRSFPQLWAWGDLRVDAGSRHDPAGSARLTEPAAAPRNGCATSGSP